ncbi:hypothetical protein MMC13_003046 [Lambiella insularis]|nr:hypothetical protein [Lambiella insularis]
MLLQSRFIWRCSKTQSADSQKLYALYISPANFRHVATPLYINPSTRSLPVRFTLSRALQAAALAELLTTSSTISADSLIRDADGAFSALSTLLGDEEWFFGAEQPGLFDASVFAYTYLLIDGIEWRDDLLRKTLEEYQNLVEHKDRIGQKSYNIDNCARTHRDKE